MIAKPGNTFMIFISFLLSSCGDPQALSDGGIKVYDENPFYWEYKGSPLLLIGGSDEDNLFQFEDVKNQLILLKEVGGNYIRCTMSSRDKGDEKPYQKDQDDLYNLDHFNIAYWDKLNNLLQICKELDIIVQIEIWATYDFYWGDTGWAINPFNPKLNKNYSVETSGLPDTIKLPAQSEVNPFFKTVPTLDNNELVLSIQKEFVDKLLSISLNYNNVLYCIDNETNAHHDWGQYWARYLHEVAKNSGNTVFVTEMWDHFDPSAGEVEGTLQQIPELGGWFATYTNPELHDSARFYFSKKDRLSYQFLDISNHNAQKGEIHYQTGLWVRNEVLSTNNIRPITNVKIYGGDLDHIWAGNHKDAKDRFWRNIFAGHSSVRFHRPPAGIGLNDEAQIQIKSMRELTNKVDFFTMKPSNTMITQRQKNEAFCLSNDNQEMMIYFPSSGSIRVEVSKSKYELNWLHIPSTTWTTREVELPDEITTPDDDQWALLIKKI